MKWNKIFLSILIMGMVSACQKEHSIPPQLTADLSSAVLSDTNSISGNMESKGRPVRLNADDFVSGINNLYFPLKPGTIFKYKQFFRDGNDQGIENIQIEVTNNTKIIKGIICEIIHDQVFEKGILIEDTYDWYAQDKWGNVWYMGEDTKKLVEGNWITTGSWEHGVNGAVAGIIMLGHPEQHIGELYPQEYLKDSAEDKARVISCNSTASIQFGTFTHCVVTEETTRLSPGVKEYKYYAPGIGNISTILNIGGLEHEELVGILR